MEKLATRLVELNRENTKVLFISNRNNVVIEVNTNNHFGPVTINKKYFNKINSEGYVEGALTLMPSDMHYPNSPGTMYMFLGYSFK